jgi:hypothetical protein
MKMFCALALLSVGGFAFAHSGGTDAQGCHTNRKRVTITATAPRAPVPQRLRSAVRHHQTAALLVMWGLVAGPTPSPRAGEKTTVAADGTIQVQTI